jgi:hypothetical protein
MPPSMGNLRWVRFLGGRKRGRVAYGGRSGRRRGAAARPKRPLRLAWAISGGLAAALKLARATRLVTGSSRRAAASRRPGRALAAAAGSCSRGLLPAAGQLPGHRGSMAQARCHRAVMYSSIQATTLP